jgi:trimethylamine:corrinoid methyltransferase-like protein
VGFFPHQYLATVFTRQRWKGEQYLTKIADRHPYEAWQKRGATDVTARAQARLDEMMKRVEQNPLPEAACRDIDGILEDAEKYESG